MLWRKPSIWEAPNNILRVLIYYTFCFLWFFDALTLCFFYFDPSAYGLIDDTQYAIFGEVGLIKCGII